MHTDRYISGVLKPRRAESERKGRFIWPESEAYIDLLLVAGRADLRHATLNAHSRPPRNRPGKRVVRKLDGF